MPFGRIILKRLWNNLNIQIISFQRHVFRLYFSCSTSITPEAVYPNVQGWDCLSTSCWLICVVFALQFFLSTSPLYLGETPLYYSVSFTANSNPDELHIFKFYFCFISLIILPYFSHLTLYLTFLSSYLSPVPWKFPVIIFLMVIVNVFSKFFFGSWDNYLFQELFFLMLKDTFHFLVG